MKISIITVTYNCSDVLNHCLTSVKNQSYKNIEHIVIDGGSSNNTMELLKAKKNQLSFLLSEPDKGVYDAMNKGIENAKGDIIGFLNADDFYANHKVLSKVADLFKSNSKLDACYADLNYVNPKDTTKIIRYWKSNKFVSGLFSKGWCPPHPTFFVRSSIYKKYGKFNLKYRISSDVDLMIRFLEVYRIRTKYVSEVWVKMRLGGISNSSLKNIILQNIDVLRALKSYRLNSNFIIFFSHKIIIRIKQFLKAKNLFIFSNK